MSHRDAEIDTDLRYLDDASRASSSTLDFLFWLSQLATDFVASGLANESLKANPRILGHFQLESLLGTGTYGAVFKAVDLELDRTVALKVAWPAVLLDPESSRRFVDEPKTVAALEHPGIVRVYDSGTIEMARYIALELIEGQTLAEWAKSQDQVPVAAAVQIVHGVAEALGYAHQHGIVHRDLKPSNILLRSVPSGADASQVTPVVTDFGLARRPSLSDATSATATHAILGTDRYMSPEQASGLAKEVGSESDVFSLGVILYELLAGRRPFDGESGVAIREQIQRDDPPKLRPWRKSVHRDIETIVFKCLEKMPNRRYASAGELADDLRRFQSHEPIRARPANGLARAWKFAQRRPLLVAGLAAGILGAIIISALAGAVIEDRRAAARELAAAHEAAVAAEGMERQHQYATMIRNAAKAQSRGNRADAIRYLRECTDLATPPVQRGIEWNLLSATVNHVDQVLRANFGGVRTVRFSPSGELMICGGSDNRLIFWDTATWKPRRSVFNTGRAVKCAEFSADGSLLAVGGENGRVVVHRLADESILFDEKLIQGRVFDIAWLGDAHTFVAGGEDGVLWFVDPKQKETRQSGPLEPSPEARAIDSQHPNEVTALAYLADRNLVAVLKAPVEIVLVDPKPLQTVETWSHEFGVAGIGEICRVRQGREYLAAAGASGIQFCDTQGKVVAKVDLSQTIEEMQFCLATKSLVACCRDGSSHAWRVDDILAGQPDRHHSVQGHGSRALTVGISSDGQWLATGGRDGSVRVWDQVSAGDSADTPMEHQPRVVEFSPCGRWLCLGEALAGGKATLSLFDASSGRRLWMENLPAVPQGAQATSILPWFPCAFDASGEELALSLEPGGFETRRCATGQVVKKYHSAAGVVQELRFSGDGRKIIVGGMPRCILLDRDSGAPLDEFTGSNAVVGSFMTQEGERWLTTDSSRVGILRRSPKGSILKNLGRTDERVSTAAITRDGRYLAGGGKSLEVYLWDLAKNNPPARLLGHEGWINNLRFTRDGNTLVSLGADGILKFWHVPTRSELLTIGSPDDRVLCFSLHPQGQSLVLGMQHGQSFGLRTYRLREAGESVSSAFEVTHPSSP